MREVLVTDEPGQNLPDRLEQGLGRAPVTRGPQFQVLDAVMALSDDLAEALIPFEEPVEWLELG